MGLFYVPATPNIMDLFYVLSTMGLSYVQQIPNIMGLFYVPATPNIMDLFYVLSTMGLSYVQQIHITLWVFFMWPDPFAIMGLSYVLPRPLYIRRTHNKKTCLHGSLLCVIIVNYSGRTL